MSFLFSTHPSLEGLFGACLMIGVCKPTGTMPERSITWPFPPYIMGGNPYKGSDAFQ
jgi:hypothetical protein